MNKIEILENKKLVLKNVIKKKLTNLPYDQIDSEVQKFQTKIYASNPKPFGPLIMCNRGTHLSDDGAITVDLDIMVQASEYHKMKSIYDIEEKHECHNCLVAKYEGPGESVELTYQKLEIFIFENNLTSTGITYTLYKQSVSEEASIDVFKQVEDI